MKPTKDKKLKLNTETLRHLQPAELREAVGGVPYYTYTHEASGCMVTTMTLTTLC
jgi:hypothetical protein